MEIVAVEDDGKNQHGFPRGYHFVPKDTELVRLLDDKLAGRPLPYPLPNIFHDDVRILDYHPSELYEKYKAHEEAGFVYFFSRRQFLNPGGKKTRPVRVAKDGGWTASGGGKLVSAMTRGSITHGYELTMVFYKKGKKKKEGNTGWGMHEYTKIIGPNISGRKKKDLQFEDLALYRLYKVKKKKDEEGQHVPTLSNGSPKSEEQAQASIGQPHDYYQQYALAAAPSAPGPSSWANPPRQLDAGCMALTGSPPASLMAPSLQATATSVCPQQQGVNEFELADWDNTLPMAPSLSALLAPSTVSEPAAVGHNLPTSQQQDAQHPGPAVSNEQLLKMLLPPPLPVPATAAEVGYLDDEFKVLCEMQPAASPCWLPMLDDDDLPMLTDEENQLYACTFAELLGPMHDDGDAPGTR